MTQLYTYPSVIANARDFDDSGEGTAGVWRGMCWTQESELTSQFNRVVTSCCDLGQAHQTSTGLPFYIHKMGIILPHYVLPWWLNGIMSMRLFGNYKDTQQMHVIITQKSDLKATESKQPQSWDRLSELGFCNNRKENLCYLGWVWSPQWNF